MATRTKATTQAIDKASLDSPAIHGKLNQTVVSRAEIIEKAKELIVDANLQAGWCSSPSSQQRHQARAHGVQDLCAALGISLADLA